MRLTNQKLILHSTSFISYIEKHNRSSSIHPIKETTRLAKTKIKISSTVFERGLAERDILNQIESAYNTLDVTSSMIGQLSAMVDNYQRLLSAEFMNLENGESDLFKINIQQEKLINAQAKFLKMLSEYEKSKALLYWSAGVSQLGFER